MPQDKDAALEPALRDIESIQSLDTARLALRWALERMRALEKRAEELASDAKTAEAARAKTSAELEAAQELLSRRLNEALERERYYSKIEEYLNLRLEGGIDPAALAKREARLEEREAAVQRREIDSERALKAAQLRRDDELRTALAELSAASETRLLEARGDYDKRVAALERTLSERQISLHEKEAQLSALERGLEERRKRFEEFHAAQRAALERESASINQASQDQAGFLERRIELALAAKTKALESAAQTEKQLLLGELAEWRAKAREHLPELLDAQRKAQAAEDAMPRLKEENALLRKDKELLDSELSRWRRQAQDNLPSLLAAVRRAEQAEERAELLETELASARRLAEVSLAEAMSGDLVAEKRQDDLSKLEGIIAAKLRDAERNLFRQYDSWVAREEELRHRDQDWRRDAEARRESTEALRAEIMLLKDELKKTVASYRAKLETNS
ncbi:MAG: hypothetical protein A2V88_16570 [Elusimicrobia bacterium RBG_16_66_12]|nr:MAG: hypothetical protein A2V88_16570 [Elusimicrobia bacterium RBG_16_66_12]